jgi:biotin synthase
LKNTLYFSIGKFMSAAHSLQAMKKGMVIEMGFQYEELLHKSLERPVTREEALQLFQWACECQEKRGLLYEAARQVRKQETGDRFRLTGGISSVLPCHLNPLCLYCPYWRGTDKQVVSTEVIVQAARNFQQNGIREFHLSGGTTLGSDGAKILSIVDAIWQDGIRDMEITVNCGAAMSVETMKKLKAKGVVKIGAVFEIANISEFTRLKPGDSFQEKEAFAWNIKSAGLSMHSGIMAGLGASDRRYEDYVETLFYLKQFPHMVSLYISKFRPDPSIPMRNHPQCSLEEACMLVAVTRLVLRGIDIRIAAGWGRAESEQGIIAGGGNELCALMLNHHAPYWKTGKEGSVNSIESGETAFIDTREEKRQMVARMGLTLV